MERAWEVIKSVGGVVLLVEFAVYLAGSGHAGHLLRNSREFAVAFDHITQNIVREVMNAVGWLIAKGR